jgi:ABC-type uncharacterized transport system involved in gliding motility auxiliary subunit
MNRKRGAIGHSLRQGALMAFQVAVATVAVGMIAVLAERRNVRFDLTPTQSFVLSDEARNVAASLEKPVRITVFYNSQQQEDRRHSEDLLKLFENASPNIETRMLDLDRNPRLASEFGISAYNTGVIESDGEVLSLKGTAQENIVGTLLQLTRKQPRTLCFTTGHGEHSPRDPDERKGYSEVGKALEFENFGIRAIDVVPPSGVPRDCTVLVIAGPAKELLPGEADQLASFLRAGGRILMMLDPDAPPSFTQFAADFGVRTTDDVVVEERNRFYGADSFMPRVPVFDRETFGENLDTAAVFALARTLAPSEQPPPGARVLLLAITAQDSWARVGGAPASEDELQFRRDVDHLGPLPVGVMVTGSARQPEGAPKAEPLKGRMIVFGDSDFASNLYLNILGNKDLFMSSVAVLAEDQELVAMRSKSDIAGPLSPIYLTAEQARRIFWTSVVITPGLIALMGMIVVTLRRRRAGR